MTIYYKNIEHVNDKVYTKFGKIRPSILKILSKNQFLTTIKGRYSVEHLPKKTL